jgi:hypothetical protein
MAPLAQNAEAGFFQGIVRAGERGSCNSVVSHLLAYSAVGPYLRLSRVLALIGGLGLIAAFFMPWFSSQGLLLSGQFLHSFLSNASAADLRRFLPSSTPQEVTLLRLLVDLFPVCGALAFVFALLGGLVHAGRTLSDVLLALSGAVPLVAWAVGITRLPPGAALESGLWLIAFASVAIVVGAVLELIRRNNLHERHVKAV